MQNLIIVAKFKSGYDGDIKLGWNSESESPLQLLGVNHSTLRHELWWIGQQHRFATGIVTEADFVNTLDNEYYEVGFAPPMKLQQLISKHTIVTLEPDCFEMAGATIRIAQTGSDVVLFEEAVIEVINLVFEVPR